MTIQTFEYCSLYYLNQWLAYDLGYCEALSSGTKEEKLSTLKSAGGFYSVARNLPREYDEKEGRYQPVLTILDSVSKELFPDNTESKEKFTQTVSKILGIEQKISKKYGDRKVLSLTTKFLWLKIQEPIIIYDSQAANAVGSKAVGSKAVGSKKVVLADYYEKWTDGFEKHKKQIEKACSQLPKLYLYAVGHERGTKEYIKEVSSKPWFHKRVFDIYLWDKGDNA
jgi:hypothetical protein